MSLAATHFAPVGGWYLGTADAIFQNIDLIEQWVPQLVAIFGGDHIYRMNVASMIDFHLAKQAELTVAAIPVPREQAREFGVIQANEDGRIMAFHEKKPNAPTMPGDSNRVYASMGNYIFSTRPLLELLKSDANDATSQHDFGINILPRLAGNAPIYAYNLENNGIPGEPEDSVPYWRDVGTIEAFYEANMDLNHVKPELISTIVSGQCAARATPIRQPSSSSMTITAVARLAERCRRALASDYSRKLTLTLIFTGTGSPPLLASSKRHLRTASTTFSSNPIPRECWTRISCVLPAGVTICHRTTVPWSFAVRASFEYSESGS